MKRKASALNSALGQQRKMMSRTGKLNLSDLDLENINLEELGNQKALLDLDLSKNARLTSFQALPRQSCLKNITADDCGITNLSGLSSQPRLSSISLQKTPISKIDNFRIAVLLAVGPRLSSINGTAVSKSERLRYLCYPPIAKKLVISGWVPVYPPPPEEDFRYLVQQFHIQADKTEFEIPSNQTERLPPSPRKSKPEPTDFGERLAAILRPLGFGIRYGDERDEDIISAVDQICQTIQLIEAQNVIDKGEEEEIAQNDKELE